MAFAYTAYRESKCRIYRDIESLIHPYHCKWCCMSEQWAMAMGCITGLHSGGVRGNELRGRKVYVTEKDIHPVINLVKNKSRLSKKVMAGLSTTSRRLLRERKKLQVDSTGLLKRVIQGPNGSQRLQIVLPELYRLLAIKELHSKMGHLEAERVTALIRECFFLAVHGS